MKNCWAEKIQEFATNTPDKVAIIDEETKLTYKKLWEYSCGFAKYLKQQGHQKGQVVICQAYGKIAYVVTYVATLIAKGIFSPIDKETVLSKFLDQKECLPDVFCVVHNFDYTFEREVKIDDVLSIAQQNAEFLTVEFDVNDDAQILFTSGSTLKPKAVLTTNAQLLQGKDVAKVLGHQSDTVGLLMSPVHHYAFFGLALPFFIVGGTYVMFNVFNIKKALDLVVEHKVNAFFATPSIYKMLSVVAKDKFSQIFANARSLFTGAEFVPQPVKDWLRKEAPNSGLYAIYGATETAFVAIHRFDVEEKPFGCVGPLLPGVEVEIRDVGANVVAIKSPHVMKKYLGREDHQGWFETSDLAYYEDGRLYVLGRADDVIVSGGTKINPAEIEDAAKRFDGITQCVCVGVADEFLGNVAKLYYLATKPINLKEFKAHLAERIEFACLPKVFEQVETIQTTPSGKLDRKWYKNNGK